MIDLGQLVSIKSPSNASAAPAMVRRRRRTGPRVERLIRNARALWFLRQADRQEGYVRTDNGIPISTTELRRGCVAHNPYQVACSQAPPQGINF